MYSTVPLVAEPEPPPTGIALHASMIGDNARTLAANPILRSKPRRVVRDASRVASTGILLTSFGWVRRRGFVNHDRPDVPWHSSSRSLQNVVGQQLPTGTTERVRYRCRASARFIAGLPGAKAAAKLAKEQSSTGVLYQGHHVESITVYASSLVRRD